MSSRRRQDLKARYRSKGWFSVRFDFIDVLGFEAACVAAYLVNVEELFEDKNKATLSKAQLKAIPEDYFPLPVGKVRRDLHISKQVHDRVFLYLRNTKAIQIKQVKMPYVTTANQYRRMVYFDYELIDDRAQEIKQMNAGIDPDNWSMFDDGDG